MKKLMKAIAFATVMCMLLSTAAFAADLTIADSKVTVVVDAGTSAANQQIAFVAAKSTITNAADLATGNILDVQQTALDAEGKATVTLGTGSETAASIFYGYQSNPEDEAVFKTAAVAEAGATVEIKAFEWISDAEINDYAAANPDKEIVETETDKAGAIKAKVLVNAGELTVTDMIWSIRHTGANGVSYVKADSTLFNVLTGDVEIGLAFSNGNRKTEEGAIAEVEIIGLEAIVKLSDNSVIFSEETPFDSSDAQKKPVASEEN